MLVPACELMFGKLLLRNLFEDHFNQSGHRDLRIMLKPLEDPHFNLIAIEERPGGQGPRPGGPGPAVAAPAPNVAGS